MISIFDVVVANINKATDEEIQALKTAIDARESKNIDPKPVLQHIINTTKAEWKGDNKLYVIKRFKELTGMGLKDAKDWCDINIFPHDPAPKSMY